MEFMLAMHPIALQILRCFAVGLGLESDYFDKVRAARSLIAVDSKH